MESFNLKPGGYEVKVNAGEIIPRDALLINGKTFVDESMLTGESNPVFKGKGDPFDGRDNGYYR